MAFVITVEDIYNHVFVNFNLGSCVGKMDNATNVRKKFKFVNAKTFQIIFNVYGVNREIMQKI